jgi:hypothetical protein
VQHKLVDVVVTTAGGIEEDFIKCMAPTYMGDFAHKGLELRKQVRLRLLLLPLPPLLMLAAAGSGCGQLQGQARLPGWRWLRCRAGPPAAPRA